MGHGREQPASINGSRPSVVAAGATSFSADFFLVVTWPKPLALASTSSTSSKNPHFEAGAVRMKRLLCLFCRIPCAFPIMDSSTCIKKKVGQRIGSFVTVEMVVLVLLLLANSRKS